MSTQQGHKVFRQRVFLKHTPFPHHSSRKLHAVEEDSNSVARDPEHGVVVVCIEGVVQGVIGRSLNCHRLADHDWKCDGATRQRVEADDVSEVYCAAVGGVLESGQEAGAVSVGEDGGSIVVTGTTCKVKRNPHRNLCA